MGGGKKKVWGEERKKYGVGKSENKLREDKGKQLKEYKRRIIVFKEIALSLKSKIFLPKKVPGSSTEESIPNQSVFFHSAKNPEFKTSDPG